MDVMTLESEVIKCHRRKDWLGAVLFLEQYVADANPCLRGAAMFHKAGMLAKIDPESAQRCIGLLQGAIPLLNENHRLLIMARLQVAGLCLATDDLDTGLEHCCAGMSVICKLQELRPWRERFLDVRSQLFRRMAERHFRSGHMDAATELYARAKSGAQEAIAWFQKNTGPWDEHDDACYLRKAHLLHAEIQWARGERTEAVKEAADLLPELAVEDPAAYHFWLGRQSLLEGNADTARHDLHIAYSLSAQGSDHFRTARIGVTVAEVHVLTHDETGLRDLMEPLLRKAASVCNVGLIDQCLELIDSVGRDLHEAVR